MIFSREIHTPGATRSFIHFRAMAIGTAHRDS